MFGWRSFSKVLLPKLLLTIPPMGSLIPSSLICRLHAAVSSCFSDRICDLCEASSSSIDAIFDRICCRSACSDAMWSRARCCASTNASTTFWNRKKHLPLTCCLIKCINWLKWNRTTTSACRANASWFVASFICPLLNLSYSFFIHSLSISINCSVY